MVKLKAEIFQIDGRLPCSGSCIIGIAEHFIITVENINSQNHSLLSTMPISNSTLKDIVFPSGNLHSMIINKFCPRCGSEIIYSQVPNIEVLVVNK